MIMKRHIRTFIIFSLSSSVLLLSGCMFPGEMKQRAMIKKKVNHGKKVAARSFVPPKIARPGNITVYHQFYAEHVERMPEWLQKHIDFEGQTELLTFIKQALLHTGIEPLFQNGADPNRVITVHIHGTVNDLLKQLSEQTGYQFLSSEHRLTIADKVTQTFHVDSVPGKSDFDLGKSTDEYAIGSITASAGGNNSQHSQEKGQISVWKDIQTGIHGLLSPQGKLEISESGSLVTVTDHYRQVKKIGAWIKNYNTALDEQVHFKVQVLTIDLTHTNNRNFNLNLMNLLKIKNSTFSLKGGSPLTVSPPAGLTGGAGQSFTISGGKGVFNLIIQKLQEQGLTTERNETVLTALNNHVAQLRQTLTTSYLAQTKLSASGGDSSSQDIEYQPGQVTTGFELYIIPHIEGNKVKMRVTMNLANLLGMQSYSLGSNKSPSTVTGILKSKLGADPSSSNNVKLSFPKVATRKFNQDAIVTNGDTLVIGGFKSDLLWMGANKNFGISGLGAYQAAHKNTMLVFLITPYITMKHSPGQ